MISSVSEGGDHTTKNPSHNMDTASHLQPVLLLFLWYMMKWRITTIRLNSANITHSPPKATPDIPTENIWREETYLQNNEATTFLLEFFTKNEGDKPKNTILGLYQKLLSLTPPACRNFEFYIIRYFTLIIHQIFYIDNSSDVLHW